MATNISTKSKPKESTSAESPESKDVNRLSCESKANDDMEEGNAKKNEYIEKLDTRPPNKENDATVATCTRKEDQTVNNNDKSIKKNQLRNDEDAKKENQTKTDNDSTEIVSISEEDISEITCISEKDFNETTNSKTQTVSTKTIPAQTDVSATEDQPRKLRRSTRNQSFKKVCNVCSTVYKDGWEKCEICSAIDESCESSDSNDSDADNSCKEANDSDPEILFINKRKSLDSKGNSKSKKQQRKSRISQDSDIELITSSSQAKQQNQLSLVSHEKLQTVSNSSKHTNKEDSKQISQNDRFPSVMFCDACNTGYAHPIDFQCHYKILDCKGVSNNKTPSGEAGDKEKGNGDKSKSEGEYSSSSTKVYTQLTPHYPSYSDFCRLIPYDPSSDKRIWSKKQINRVQRCFKCNMFFPSLDEFMIHLNAENDKLRKLYGTQNCLQCRWCSHRAQSLCRLQQHRFITHRMVCCTVCDKLLPSRGDLVKHMHIHPQEDVKSDKSTNDTVERNVQDLSDPDSIEMHEPPIQLVDVSKGPPSTETSDDQGEDDEVLPQKNDNSNKSAGIKCYSEVVKDVPDGTLTKLLKRKVKKSHMRSKFGKHGVYVCKMCDAMCQTDIALSNHKKEFHPVVYKLEQLDVQYGPAWRAKANKKKKKKRKKHEEKEIEPASENSTQTHSKPEVTIGSIGNQVIQITDTVRTQGASGPKIINESGKVAAPLVNKTPAIVPLNAQTPINKDDKLSNIQDAAIQSNISSSKIEGNVKEDSAENKQAKSLPECLESSDIQEETKAVNGECKSPNNSAAVGSDVPGTSTGGVTESGTSKQGFTLQQISKIPSSKQYYKNPVKRPLKDKIEEDSFSSSGDETDASECSWLDQSSDEDDEDDTLEPGEIRLPEDDIASNSNGVGEEDNAIKKTNAQEAQPASKIVPRSISTTTLPNATPVKEMPKETSSTQQNTTTNFMSELPANVLQLSNLLRTFHMVDVSELYQVAAQLIDPKDPGEGPIDEAMNFDREEKFLYKIPLGHSHPEFEDQALFPSSREVCYRTHKYKYNPQQILSVKELEKRYKRTVPKYMADIFSKCLDDAMLTHTDKLLRSISINVRRKKAEDRKDLTQRLVKYIVSRYYAKHAQEGTKVESGSAIKIQGLSASLIISPKNATPTTEKLPAYNPATSTPSTSQIPNKVTSTIANLPQKEDTDSRISKFASMSSIRVRRFEMNHMSLSDTIGRIQHIQKFMASGNLPLKVKEKIAPLCNEICDPAVPLNQKVRNVRTMEFLFTQDCGGQWNKYRTAANLPTMQKASALSSRSDKAAEQDDSCEEISAGEEGDKEKSNKKEKHELTETITNNKEKIKKSESHEKILKEQTSKFDKEEQIEMCPSTKGKISSRRSSKRLNKEKSDDEVEMSDTDNGMSSKTDEQNKMVNNYCEEISKKEDNTFNTKDKNEINKKAENNDKLTKSASNDETLAEDADNNSKSRKDVEDANEVHNSCDKMTSAENKNKTCHNEETTELEKITQDKTNIKQSYNDKELPEGENVDGQKLNENVSSATKTSKTNIDSKFNSKPDHENHTENGNESCRNDASNNDLNIVNRPNVADKREMKSDINNEMEDDESKDSEYKLTTSESANKVESKMQEAINSDKESKQKSIGSAKEATENVNRVKEEQAIGGTKKGDKEKEEQFNHKKKEIGETLQQNPHAKVGISAETMQQKTDRSGHTLQQKADAKEVTPKNTLQHTAETNVCASEGQIQKKPEVRIPKKDVPKWTIPWNAESSSDSDSSLSSDSSLQKIVLEAINRQQLVKQAQEAQRLQREAQQAKNRELAQQKKIEELSMKKYFDSLPCPGKSTMTHGVCLSTQAPEIRLGTGNVNQDTNISEKSKLEVQEGESEKKSDNDKKMEEQDKQQEESPHSKLSAKEKRRLELKRKRTIAKKKNEEKLRKLAVMERKRELLLKQRAQVVERLKKGYRASPRLVAQNISEVRQSDKSTDKDGSDNNFKRHKKRGETTRSGRKIPSYKEEQTDKLGIDRRSEPASVDSSDSDDEPKRKEKASKTSTEDNSESESDESGDASKKKSKPASKRTKLAAKTKSKMEESSNSSSDEDEQSKKVGRKTRQMQKIKRIAKRKSRKENSSEDGSYSSSDEDDTSKKGRKKTTQTMKARQIAKRKSRKENSSEDGSDSSSEEEDTYKKGRKKTTQTMKARQSTIKSKTATKNTSKKEDSSEDDFDASSEVEDKYRKGGKKMAQNKKTVKTKSSNKAKKEGSSEDGSDSPREENMKSKKGTKKTLQAKKIKQTAKTKSKKDESSEDSNDSSSEEESKSKKSGKKTKQAVQTKSMKEESSEDGYDSSSEEESKSKKCRKKTAQTQKTKQAAKSRSKKEESSEESNDSSSEEESKSKKSVKKSAQTKKTKRATKTKSKKKESSEDSSDSWSEEEAQSKKEGKKTAQTKKTKQAVKTKTSNKRSKIPANYESSSSEEEDKKDKTTKRKSLKSASKSERRGRKRKDASSTTSPESDSTSSSDFFVKKTNICTKMTPAIHASVNSKTDKYKQGSNSNGPVKISQSYKRQRIDSTSESDLERHENASVNNRTRGSNQCKQSNQKCGKDKPSNAPNRKRPHKPAEDSSSGSDDSEVEFTMPAKKSTREKSGSSTKASGSGRTRRSNVLNQLGLTEQEIRDMVQAPRRGGNKR